MKTNTLYYKYYAGNPTWKDGTTQFKAMIKSYLKKDFILLDIGAGKGPPLFYKGMVKQIIGIDISNDIMENIYIDTAYQCDANNLSFKDNSFDIAYADCVAEHLLEPIKAAREIYRVLKPGGLLFIRTPNLWHYVTLASYITPYSLHKFLKKRLQGESNKSAFRTYYYCNTKTKIKKVFLKAGFVVEKISIIETEPSYLMEWNWTFLLGIVYERIVNTTELFSMFRANILAIFQKPEIIKPPL